MQLQVVDLKNLVYLAKKGIVAISDTIKTEEAKAGWIAISNAEAFLENFSKVIAQQQAAKSPDVVTTGNQDGTTSDLHIVNLNEDGSVHKDSEPKVENLES